MKPKKIYAGKKAVLAVSCAVAVAAVAAAVFSDRGLLDVWRLKNDRDAILAYNRSIELENRELEEKVGLLKTDRRYIGYIARKELGMIGKDEVLYKIEPAKTGQDSTVR